MNDATPIKAPRAKRGAVQMYLAPSDVRAALQTHVEVLFPGHKVEIELIENGARAIITKQRQRKGKGA